MRPVASAEQEELRSSVREFCANEVSPERLLAWESDAAGVDAETMRRVAELGWLGLGLPASAGGSEAPLDDVASLVEECARGLLARPVIGAIRGASALACVDPKSAHLRALASGEMTLALALDEDGARDPRHYATRLEKSGSDARLNGTKASVPGAATAKLHLVAAQEGLVLVEGHAPGVRIEPVRSFGSEPQANVVYQGTPILQSVGADAALQRLRREQVALALAEMVGGMDAVLAMTVAYVKERQQFGQKIALFQAVRHQIADMGTTFTAARHLAWQAITRVAHGLEQGTELASAAAYVGQAFKRICWTGHHLHGGAGFVVEHRLRFHSERAQSLCIRYAPEGPALAEIASALLD